MTWGEFQEELRRRLSSYAGLDASGHEPRPAEHQLVEDAVELALVIAAGEEWKGVVEVWAMALDAQSPHFANDEPSAEAEAQAQQRALASLQLLGGFWRTPEGVKLRASRPA